MDTSRPIIALDVPSAQAALDFVRLFEGESLFVKVGMELFYAAGPQVVTQMREAGHDVFCDLKLHDIPNTVRGAARSLSRLGASLLTVHAAGGQAMMEAALEGLREGAGAEGEQPSVVAITQLTSTSPEAMRREQLIEVPLQESVLNYARVAQAAGVAGVVCSAWEAAAIKDATSEDFLRITPGIRPEGADIGDQARVVTPSKAAQMASSGIVVGRPIVQAADPVAAYHEIKAAWNS
ncbi:orotidine-5'-phosphate decarboxylase [Boudabousia marimammalium]|uniref:Orotidine 5'-phosphate decarboxylase n=1 Tax=Boudabousia marimammalium TaxID=156892 RepID=A0A1Q5PSI9_9ACTO|nr:orotidine-5'-phosphate decarboxylase [Boudabousia marimammalium]OKL50526.1 orotidine 5'-phosphate decarboxylase [Boudabousia marimammalium]